jgi:hypothetical protein
LERWIKLIAGSTISIIIGGVMWGIIYWIIIVKGEVLTGVVFLALIIGLVLFALLMLYRESLLKASGKGQALQPAAPPQAGNTARLLREPPLESVPSVTERTTELLTVEKKGGTE